MTEGKFPVLRISYYRCIIMIFYTDAKPPSCGIGISPLNRLRLIKIYYLYNARRFRVADFPIS